MKDILHRNRYEFFGLAAVLALLLILALAVAAYLKVFTPAVTVTVKADRSGLLMQRDNDVSLRSVTIGKVTDVRPDGPAGSLLDIYIESDKAQFVPANSTAQLVAPTVFGPKYVDFLAPARPASTPISDGAVVDARQVQVEVNSVFDNLQVLLTTFRPARVNAALGAVSTALQGRGERLGRVLSQGNSYLSQLNPSMPALRRDLARLPEVAGTYADVAPGLLELVGNLTATSRTVVQEQRPLEAFIGSLTRFDANVTPVLEQNRPALAETLRVLRPTTALLQRYSPMFPCLFHGINTLRELTEPNFGGLVPGLHTLTTFEPGREGYKYPENLPRLGVDAPGCYGGVPAVGTWPRHVYHPDGSPRLNYRDQPVTPGDTPLSTQLFGPLAPQVTDALGALAGAGQAASTARAALPAVPSTSVVPSVPAAPRRGTR